MQDRLSTYPGRIKLTPVVGQENVYDVERMDEPSQLGTELKTETLLSDATAAALGLDNTATPNTAFAKIKDMLEVMDGKIIEAAIGTYTGAGGYGEDNPNKLTFSFEPKLIIVQAGIGGGYSGQIIFIRGQTETENFTVISSESGRITVSWSGKKVTWYNHDSGSLTGSPIYQCNASGKVYHYIAIG